MTDEPDFTDLEVEGDAPSSNDSGSRSRTEFKQMHIQGRFGTETVKNTEGCQVCGKNSDLVLMTDVVEGEVEPDWDRLIQTCESHEGDVLGDLEYPSEKVQKREF